MLSQNQINSYNENGYIGVENILDDQEITELSETTDHFVEKSREVTEHTSAFDLEPGHTTEQPRLRRLKSPIELHEVYRNALHHPRILEIVSQLIGYGLRCNGNKLNMKLPEFGSPVEWHQDWGFYPHTNDDLLAVGICIDDMTIENGALLVVPGSHKGKIYDHHYEGHFSGAITDPTFDDKGAIPIVLKAGGISIHHARTIHGSTPNHSQNPRRLLLFQYCANDAWPLGGFKDWESFNDTIVRGEPTNIPRVREVPVRMPLPPSIRTGSIYESQTIVKNRKFAQ
ncbi:MAG: phytanoyl-CoA dioxygenase family protein [Candidatus Latescibacterota bacterium]|nr:phytanoyl-CoA dioxygenase family protein [Candidatus Latescibacterota bacterium]